MEKENTKNKKSNEKHENWPMYFVIILIIVAAVYSFFGNLGNRQQSVQTENKQSEVVDRTAQDQIDQLKQEVEALKNQKPITTGKDIIHQNISGSITSQELSAYLTGVGRIQCFRNGTSYSYGSGSFWNIENEYYVLTNRHVISTDNCDIFVVEDGSYKLPNTIKTYNSKIDMALLKLTASYTSWSTAVSKLNYSISKLPRCLNPMPVGSPVVLVGFPSSGNANNSLSRITTDGTISGQDNTPFSEGMSAPNYFVSAKLDAGNSGGIAFSKSSDGLCVLGIPTWVSVGTYDTQGMVQNIHNILP